MRIIVRFELPFSTAHLHNTERGEEKKAEQNSDRSKPSKRRGNGIFFGEEAHFFFTKVRKRTTGKRVNKYVELYIKMSFCVHMFRSV